jgi:hypothetical protein
MNLGTIARRLRGQQSWSDLARAAEPVLVPFVASRLIIFALIIISKMVMVRAYYWHPGGLLSVLTQWDGELWYIGIARKGYTFSTTGPSSLPFFPFYPILVKLVSFVFRDMRVAAVLTSHACLLAAGFFLHALIRIDYKDPRVARAAVMFLMFSPVSFFFSNAYTESTFLMLATGAFLAARKGHWLVASLAGMCLAATRNVGLLITLPVVHRIRAPNMETWRDRTRTPPSPRALAGDRAARPRALHALRLSPVRRSPRLRACSGVLGSQVHLAASDAGDGAKLQRLLRHALPRHDRD